MIKAEVTVTVYEKNDPLVSLHIDSESSTGVLTSYDFTAAQEVSFIIKRGVAVDDAQATAAYTVTNGKVVVTAPPTAGNLTVQMNATDLATAGNYRYRVDVKKNNKVETIMLGPLIITNT